LSRPRRDRGSSVARSTRPAKIPAEIVTKIHADTLAALARASVKRRYQAIGAPGERFDADRALLASDAQKWGPIVNEDGIKVE
jgi:hypothetical protein